MNTEKLAAQARTILLAVSLLGVVVLLGGVVLTGRSIQQGMGAPAKMEWELALSQAAPGVIVAAAGLLLAGLPWVLFPLTLLVAKLVSEMERTEQITGTLETHRQLLEGIRETSSLSDAAKQIAYRQKDRDMLRTAIKEDIDRGDFEAANSLVDEMERRYGHKHEAEVLREQIETGWAAARDAEMRERIGQLEGWLGKFEWAEAQKQYGRLAKLYPDHPEVQKLPERMAQAKDGHKRELLKQWKDAVTRDDVDKSVELLKELDQYLTPSEAEAYKESARDVFRKRLQQLGVQFALHVHDKSWTEALRIGKQITDEFPNTRIAAEVRERMAILEDNAGTVAGV